MKALWNRNFLQRVGYISYSSRPDQEPALLDCKGTAFILYGRKPDLGVLSTPYHEETSCCIGRIIAMLLAACQRAITINIALDSSGLAAKILHGDTHQSPFRPDRKRMCQAP